MTRLTQDDIEQLRRARITINVSDEQLTSETPDFMRFNIAKEAAQEINHLANLPKESISPDELNVRQTPDPKTMTTKLAFNWEPSTERFAIELLGGPRDGERMMTQEQTNGHLKIAQQTQPVVTTEPDPYDGPETKYGTYKETGWDTKQKIWIYTWTNK